MQSDNRLNINRENFILLLFFVRGALFHLAANLMDFVGSSNSQSFFNVIHIQKFITCFGLTWSFNHVIELREVFKLSHGLLSLENFINVLE